ncbi:MAG: HDOD domain-containing protein [Proteobacteria bacterium]|nr:HDOD domain-containing protein [Pseudomonadota bacterium]MBU1709296.1 HDOD domain-containing protein [Pseudomonadota bacterium]
MSKKPENNFDAWLQRLNQEDMPIFGRTVQEIVSVAENSDSSVSELTRVVLQDTAMTAKVLKLANTAFYNPSNKSISTISRAIMLMGFDKVRAITLTVALVESIVRSANRDLLMAELARSLHAATQARSMAEKMGDKSSEEIFVATLLHNIGELAFWCFAKQEGEALKAEIKKGVPREEAEQKVLGFPLRKLTQRLVQDWHLNSLLEEALDPKKKVGKRGQLINISYDLAAAAEKGWQSEEVADTVREYSRISGFGRDEIQEMIQGNALEAARVSRTYGVSKVANIIPIPYKPGKDDRRVSKQTDGSMIDTVEEFEPKTSEIPQYNPLLQLDILREMTALLFEKPNFNVLLEMTLEGIYRGVGMDRTLFALVSPDHQYLNARFVLGFERTKMLERFKIFIASGRRNLFKTVLDNNLSVWIGQPQSSVADLVSDEIKELVGGDEFFVSPIIVSGKTIGLFYCDRIPSGRDMDQMSFENFENFARHASLGLEHITRLNKS